MTAICSKATVTEKKKKKKTPQRDGNLIGKQRKKRNCKKSSGIYMYFAGSSPAGIYAHLVLD